MYASREALATESGNLGVNPKVPFHRGGDVVTKVCDNKVDTVMDFLAPHVDA